MRRILIVGDAMLDAYTYVRSDRKSQESDCPIWDREFCDSFVLGGAANVAANVRALVDKDTDVVFAGIMENRVESMLNNRGIRTVGIRPIDGMQLTKHRFVDKEKIIFRFDNAKRYCQDDILRFERLIRSYLSNERFDIIIISDYDKGSINEFVARQLRDSDGVWKIVDSKKRDISIFEDMLGMSVLNVNRLEYDLIENRMPEVVFDFVVTTLGSEGALLTYRESVDGENLVRVKTYPTIIRDAVDVTGCGDTFTATLSVHLLNTGVIDESIKFANKAAGIAVGRFGTTVVSGEEVWDS